jgi:putative flippase GtrA
MDKSNKQFMLFVLFSSSAAIVQLLVFSLFFELVQFGYWMSYIPSIVALIIWNTYWNRKFTFHTNILFRTVIIKLLWFYLVFIPIFTLLGDFLVNNNLNEYIVLAMTMVCNLLLAFFYNKYYIYK